MTGSVYGSENTGSAEDNGAAAITQPPAAGQPQVQHVEVPEPPPSPRVYDAGLHSQPMPPPPPPPTTVTGPPSWGPRRAPYDTGLSTRPLPPLPPPLRPYDAGLSTTPLPPDFVYRAGMGLESPPPGAVYDTGLASVPNPYVPGPMPMPGPMPPYPSVGPPNSQADLFVQAVRTEIAQLESYFKRQTRRFRFLGAATLVLAAAVPVVIAAGAWGWIAAALGAIAAITGSLQTLFGLQAAAASAMSLAGRLESELVRYETGTTPYSSPPGMYFNQFVDRVTSLREEGTASFSSVWRSVQAPAPR